MKKIIAVLLAAILMLSVAVTAGCGKNDVGNSDDKPGKTEGSESDNDNDPEATANNDDNGDSDQEFELPYDKDSAQAKLEELGKTKGYEITMKLKNVDGSETITTSARKGDAWWSFNDDRTSGKALVSRDDKSVTEYDYNDGEWVMTSNLAGQNFSNLLPIYAGTMNIYLYMANTYQSELKHVGSEKIAGRDCSKYSYSAGVPGYSVKWNCCVDKELGITLKWSMETKDGNASGGQEMEVTEFKTGNGVIIPTFPEPGEEYTDYTGAMGWPSNSFTEMIPKAPGTVSLSMIQDGKFSAMLKGVTEAEFNAYVDALKAKGYNGDIQEFLFEGFDDNGNKVSVQFAGDQLLIAVEKNAE